MIENHKTLIKNIYYLFMQDNGLADKVSNILVALLKIVSSKKICNLSSILADKIRGPSLIAAE